MSDPNAFGSPAACAASRSRSDNSATSPRTGKLYRPGERGPGSDQRNVDHRDVDDWDVDHRDVDDWDVDDRDVGDRDVGDRLRSRRR